jgi:hypothetical protein
MTPLTQDEAREALADIDQVARLTRKALAGSQMGTNLLLWGAIWILGFTLSYVIPRETGRIWMVLPGLGIVATVVAGVRHYRQGMVQSEQARKLLGQVSLFWLVVIIYALVLGLLIPRKHGVDELTLIVCILMLGYVLMGIWLKVPILSFIGLVVTVATLVGWSYLPPRYFMLWMAVFGGGGLFVPGLYVKLRWK